MQHSCGNSKHLLQLTVRREFFIDMIAAMKNVLSPISDTKIIPHDLRKPWPEESL